MGSASGGSCIFANIRHKLRKVVSFTGSQLYQFSYNCGFGQLIAAFAHWLKRDLAFGSYFDRKYVIVFIGQLSVQVSYMRLSWVSSVLAFRPPWWFFLLINFGLSFENILFVNFLITRCCCLTFTSFVYIHIICLFLFL